MTYQPTLEQTDLPAFGLDTVMGIIVDLAQNPEILFGTSMILIIIIVFVLKFFKRK